MKKWKAELLEQTIQFLGASYPAILIHNET